MKKATPYDAITHDGFESRLTVEADLKGLQPYLEGDVLKISFPLVEGPILDSRFCEEVVNRYGPRAVAMLDELVNVANREMAALEFFKRLK